MAHAGSLGRQHRHTLAGTQGGEGSLDFLVPKGAGRFHFVGGARFVHGSAMPQEVVVPVLVIKESDTGQARTRTVEVSPARNQPPRGDQQAAV